MYFTYRERWREVRSLVEVRTPGRTGGQLEFVLQSSVIRMCTHLPSSTYSGGVVNGIRHGYGVYYSPVTRTTYSGHWVNGKREGKVMVNRRRFSGRLEMNVYRTGPELMERERER